MLRKKYKNAFQLGIVTGILLLIFVAFFALHLETKNKKLSDFKGYTEEGKIISQQVFTENDATILYFWNPLSKSAKEKAKKMSVYAEQLKKENIQLIGITIDSTDKKKVQKKIIELKTKLGTKFSNVFLEEKTKLLKDLGNPTAKSFCIIVSHEGKLIGSLLQGELDNDSSKADQYLEKAVGRSISSCEKSLLILEGEQNVEAVVKQLESSKQEETVIETTKETETTKEIQIEEATVNKGKLNTENLKSRLADAGVVIMGDSLAEGLNSYEILGTECVVAKRGAGMASLDGMIEKAVKMLPKVLVLEYGLNDIEYYNGNADRFISLYQKKIKKIQKALPDTKIYVCQVTPVEKSTIEKRPLFAQVKEYNKKIIAMCKEKKLVCLDTSNLIEEYSKDGIHPKYSYYKYWAAYIAEVLGV